MTGLFKSDLNRGTAWQFAFLLCLLAVLSLYLLSNPGTGDVRLFEHWVDEVRLLGPRDGFIHSRLDYPPLSTFALWLVATAAASLHLSSFWVVKSACLISLIASIGLLLLLYRSAKGAILFASVFMLASAGLGYLDILYTPALIVAFWALREDRLKTFSLAIVTAALIKWQPVMLFPFAAIYVIKGEPGRLPFRRIWTAAYPGAILAAAVALAYDPVNLYMSFLAAKSHLLLSGNALNLAWLITYYLQITQPEVYGGLVDGANHYVSLQSDSMIFHVLRRLFLLAFGAAVVVFAFKPRSYGNLLLYSAIGALVYFLLNTGVHENHSYIAALILCLLAISEPAFWMLAVYAALALNLNLLLFYGLGRGVPPPHTIGSVDLSVALALLNLAFFAVVFFRYVVIEGWGTLGKFIAQRRA
jgi:hypothetical protein